MITLVTLPEATGEEVFWQVKEHLLSQNQKSEEPEKCLYRSGPLKCAAGCLIADNEYNSSFDEIGFWWKLVEKNMVPSDHMDLIGDLQDIHDLHKTEDWEEELESLANLKGFRSERPVE